MTLIDDRPSTLHRMQLELTGRCPLSCSHCFTSSGPTVSHGTMTTGDWLAVVEQAAGVGARAVQLIGGEPTTSPAFVPVLERALDLGLEVEVFSNLHFPARLWELLARPGVTLATSYYDVNPAVHDQVTNRPGSHARTRSRIVEALALQVPIRVAVIEVVDGQDVEATRAELVALGIPETLIQVDRMRGIGRGAGGAAFNPAELCGSCGHGRAAVLPDGTLAPCTMGRALAAGNVRTAPLDELLAGELWAEALALVPPKLATQCSPKTDGSDCGPREQTCTPGTECQPGTSSCGPSKNFALLPVHAVTGCTPHDGSDCDPSGQTACAPDFDDAGA